MRQLSIIAVILCALGTAASAQTPRPVVSEILASGAGISRDVTGVIASQSETYLSFQTLGRLRERLVDIGDSVTRGEVLARLDQVSLQQDVDAAMATLASATAQRDTTETAFDRAQSLFDRGSLSQAQLDTAQQAKANADSGVAQAEASLAAARDALNFSVLSAPYDGVIIATMAEMGDVVAAGTPVMQMVDTDRREVLFDLPESYAAALRPDQSFQVSIRTEDTPPISGSLRLIEPVSDASLRFRRVHLSLPNDAPAAYRIGMIATVAIDGAGGALLTLPQAAIIPGDAPAVWRVDSMGDARRVTRIPVSLGEALDGFGADPRIVILEGLAAGDEIVIRGINSLTEGQSVGPRNEGQTR
ncbi:efflux RND transporter periplasmic adaptor subunit [Ketogulonicigenium vulgare]|uniref:efflux RND transporter periplasmic adaptor subunit n=1 Tax=Ketogulonicigenium vulgare TaxID=92945 RepID=UPI0023587390|nr:efflux RND transporter periplasmic adaptor subunit [Ketogulonicigenium vulgare]